jgi:hypothetical protein
MVWVMIRFVDLGRQLEVDESDPDAVRSFAFYDTISDTFINFNGSETFDDWNSLVSVFFPDEFPDDNMLQRLKGLCPDWVFSGKVKK